MSEELPDSILGARLRQLDAHADVRLAQAQRLLDLVPPPAELSPRLRLRVAARVRAKGFARPRRRLAWVALASLAMSGVAVGGGLSWRWLSGDFEIAIKDPALKRRRGSGAALSAVGGLETAAKPAAPTLAPDVPDLPAVVSPAVVSERPVAPRALARKAQVAVPAPVRAEPSMLAEESQFLAGALADLRTNRNAHKALSALKAYEQRFPDGQLGPEVNRVRVEAFLATHQNTEALGLLDRLRFSASARDTEMLVLRGELRAQATRCEAAQLDFSEALARVQTGVAAERALYGRAACHLSRGDREQARKDLQLYLQRFPRGRFATPVRRALGSG